MSNLINRPTLAFIGASWLAVVIGAVGFMIGLWNANAFEKGFISIIYFMVFSAVSLQKTLRDQLEDIPVTMIYCTLLDISRYLLVTII
jgi:uncharacterized membrane protein YiaA